MSNFFSEHRTALSGVATTVGAVVTAAASDPNLPAIAAAINPTYGAYATAGMGLLTTVIGLYNTWQKSKTQAAVIPVTAK